MHTPPPAALWSADRPAALAAGGGARGRRCGARRRQQVRGAQQIMSAAVDGSGGQDGGLLACGTKGTLRVLATRSAPSLSTTHASVTRFCGMVLHHLHQVANAQVLGHRCRRLAARRPDCLAAAVGQAGCARAGACYVSSRPKRLCSHIPTHSSGLPCSLWARPGSDLPIQRTHCDEICVTT